MAARSPCGHARARGEGKVYGRGPTGCQCGARRPIRRPAPVVRAPVGQYLTPRAGRAAIPVPPESHRRDHPHPSARRCPAALPRRPPSNGLETPDAVHHGRRRRPPSPPSPPPVGATAVDDRPVQLTSPGPTSPTTPSSSPPALGLIPVQLTPGVTPQDGSQLPVVREQRAAYNGSFVHRSIDSTGLDIWQGGGYTDTADATGDGDGRQHDPDDQPGRTTSTANEVAAQEAATGTRPASDVKVNVRGTIAMAKLGNRRQQRHRRVVLQRGRQHRPTWTPRTAGSPPSAA